MIRYVMSAAAVCMLGAPLFSGCADEARNIPTESARRPAKVAGPPPNIILIIADDQAPGTLGVEGNPIVRTPNLDRLAEEGALFTRAYVPLPQCAPSRAVLLTGLYPHQSGVVTNKDAQLDEDAVTLPGILQERGYDCGMIGKWHLGREKNPQRFFQALWLPAASALRNEGNMGEDGEHVEPFRAQPNATRFLTDRALEFIEGHDEKPFFLWLGYTAPHKPLAPPQDARFEYDAARLPRPQSISDDLADKPLLQRESIMHALYLEQSAQLRLILADYYGLITQVDFHVGRIVESLRERRLDHNTVIVYLSDNGILHGEHQMLEKGPVFYEEVVRTPMVIWAPERVKPGLRIDALVSTLDVFPTLCGLAGAPVPSNLPGADLRPLLEDQVASIHESLFLQYHTQYTINKDVPMRGLVTSRYKYVSYLAGGEELYDLQEDPFEMNNLIADSTRQKQVRMMRRKLEQLRAAAGDHP